MSSLPSPSLSALTSLPPSRQQLIIDCPGQIELYTHIPVLPRLAKLLTTTMNIQLVSVYLLESQFMEDPAKYFSGVLSAMSCMVGLEVPSVNVMSKMDLVKKGTTGEKRRKDVDRLVSPPFSSALFFEALLTRRRRRCTGSSIPTPNSSASQQRSTRTPSFTPSTLPSCSSFVLPLSSLSLSFAAAHSNATPRSKTSTWSNSYH